MFGRKKKCIHCGRNEAKFCQSCFEQLMNQNIELQVKLFNAPEDIKELAKENERIKEKIESAKRYISALQRYADYLSEELNEVN